MNGRCFNRSINQWPGSCLPFRRRRKARSDHIGVEFNEGGDHGFIAFLLEILWSPAPVPFFLVAGYFSDEKAVGFRWFFRVSPEVHLHRRHLPAGLGRRSTHVHRD
ncbi:hypothetical protein ACCAA_1550001 [Candidatus Accumulibacter aalborgensis]|uniref:Uncharacterized protein n=1 Tax=Candidatus Accumulibacter aalborgensis TaxID=1860102 RepID=A0A1A8XH70_9PROT|nr:hypothetical protein ACCAA_1550001 [Candidatus Accumulibacter aalborgensis]